MLEQLLPLMPANVQQVRAYIEQHFARIAGPDEIAEAFGVPVETLRKAFRQEAGVPLASYLRQVRVRQAKRLLRETDLRAGEVCYAVGWTREDSGERAFREAMGQTMQGYRRALRRS